MLSIIHHPYCVESEKSMSYYRTWRNTHTPILLAADGFTPMVNPNASNVLIGAAGGPEGGGILTNYFQSWKIFFSQYRTFWSFRLAIFRARKPWIGVRSQGCAVYWFLRCMCFCRTVGAFFVIHKSRPEVNRPVSRVNDSNRVILEHIPSL